MNYLIIYIDLCLPYDVLSLTFKYLFETFVLFQKDIQNLIRVLFSFFEYSQFFINYDYLQCLEFNGNFVDFDRYNLKFSSTCWEIFLKVHQFCLPYFQGVPLSKKINSFFFYEQSFSNVVLEKQFFYLNFSTIPQTSLNSNVHSSASDGIISNKSFKTFAWILGGVVIAISVFIIINSFSKSSNNFKDTSKNFDIGGDSKTFDIDGEALRNATAKFLEEKQSLVNKITRLEFDLELSRNSETNLRSQLATLVEGFDKVAAPLKDYRDYNLIDPVLCEDAYKVIDSFVRPLGL